MSTSIKTEDFVLDTHLLKISRIEGFAMFFYGAFYGATVLEILSFYDFPIYTGGDFVFV